MPVSSARRLSVTGVNGWCAVNQRTPTGIEPAGTNALDRNGSRNWTGRVEPLAPATVLAPRPRATDSQASAKANARTMPTAASQSAADARGRKPTASATPVSTVAATSARSTLPPTCPVSTAPRAIGMVRNRSMMPPVMSVHTVIAVVPEPAATVIIKMPGTRKSTYGAPWVTAPRPPPIVPPKM